MAPMAVDYTHSLKRTSSTADFHLPNNKKQHVRPTHHHKLAWVADELIRRQEPPQDEGSVHSLLTRSITLALEAVGFQGADPLAIDSLRLETEEYMFHFLAGVRQSMLACRRTQSLPLDFLQSLHQNHLSLRSLLPHLDPPVPPSKSQFALPFDEVTPAIQNQQHSTLNSSWDGKSKSKKRPYIPKSFPTFPSEHTYKATPDIPVRNNDPRKMREQAIEEGRLGEAALRKLVSVRTDDTVARDARSQRKTKSMRDVRDDLWREAMEEFNSVSLRDTNSHRDSHMDIDDELLGERAPQKTVSGPVVNAEKKYWRRPAKSLTTRMDEAHDVI